MTINTTSIRPDYLRDTRNIFALAAFLSFGFCIVGFIGEALQVVTYSLLPAAFCGIAGTFLSLAGYFLSPHIDDLATLNGAALSGYVLTITAAIHFAGGPQSFLVALYVAATVAAGFLTGRRGALRIATLSVVSFGSLVILEFTGTIPTNPIWNTRIDPQDRLVLHIALIFSMSVPTFVVAYATGTLADRLARRNVEQVALTSITRDIASSLDPDQVIRTVLRCAIEITFSDHGSIHLYDSMHTKVYVSVVEAMMMETWTVYDGATQSTARQIVTGVLQSGQSAYIPDASREFHMSAGEARSRLCVPIIQEGRVEGAIYLERHQPHSYTSARQRFVEQLAQQAAVTLDHATLFERARTVRDRLQAILDATHDGLIFYDQHDSMVLSNRAAERLLGVSLTPYLGKTMVEVLEQSGLLNRLYPEAHSRERQELLESEVKAMHADMQDGTSKVARRVIEVPAAHMRYIEEFSIRVADEHGKLIGQLIVLHDISDQKQLEVDRDAFTQMLIHDLRSPLSAIIGGLQMIELGIIEKDSPDMLLESDRIALSSARKMLKLISSLLDVQKLEAGQIDLKLEIVNFAALINETADALNLLANQYNVTLEFDVDDDLPTIRGDPEHLRRVLTNLIDNGVKFVRADGLVRVTAMRDNTSIRISIADNGPGIPEQYRQSIFERYRQVPGITGRRLGTGLGLTYSKIVVELHSGKIWVEPSQWGGSDFMFTLPAIEP